MSEKPTVLCGCQPEGELLACETATLPILGLKIKVKYSVHNRGKLKNKDPLLRDKYLKLDCLIQSEDKPLSPQKFNRFILLDK